MIDLRKMRYFRQVVESRSLSRAAEQLNVAQPALTKSIQALERELEVQLLRRSAQGMTPTEAGERLYEHCEIIFQQLDRARLDVRKTGNRPSGRAVVGLPHSVAAVLGVPLLIGAAEQLPDIRVQLVQDHTHQLTGRLHAERLDFAVIANPRSRTDLVVEPLLSEQLFFVARRDGAACSSPISFAEAAAYRYILPGSGNGLRTTIESHFRSRGLALIVDQEVDAIAIIADCVGAGLGVTVLPGGSVSRVGGYAGFDIRPFDVGCERLIAVARSASRPLGPAAEAMFDLVKRTCHQLSDNAWRGASPVSRLL